MAYRLSRLDELLNALPDDDRSRFDELFHVVSASGELRLVPGMRDWVSQQFGSVELVERQRLVRITNRWTLEESLFNELRAKRPMAATRVDIDAAIAGSAGDAFCQAETRTPEDVFGRVRGRTSMTAANIAKYEAWSAVIVFDEHNPLSLSEAGVSDAFDTAFEWIRQANAVDPEARFPFFMWNCLWPAGASIIHGHAQVALTRERHYAHIERWRSAAENYARAHGRRYFDDLFTVHQSLGLAAERDGVRMLAHLTPLKENEVVLVAPSLTAGLVRAVYRVLSTFSERLGLTSFNLGLYHPPLSGASPDWDDFPVIARIVQRGYAGTTTSDIGAMELFAASVVASDPFSLAETLLPAFAVGTA